jgi:hypothetical protein
MGKEGIRRQPKSSPRQLRAQQDHRDSEFNPIGKIIDRNWPDYNYPAPRTRGSAVRPRETISSSRAEMQPPIPRSKTAISFPMVGCGPAWAPSPANWQTVLTAKILDENQVSIGFRVSYGKFAYFTGGRPLREASRLYLTPLA